MSEETKKIVVGGEPTEEGGVNEPTYKTPEEIAAEEEGKSKEDTPKPEDTPDVVNVDDKEYILDENGNAVNEDGTVFKTKEELAELDKGETETEETEEEVEQVEIEGVVYNLKDGEAVDKDGNVKFTKEQLSEMVEEDETPEGIAVSTLIEKTAIKPYDENGNEIEYEKGEEGLVAYANDVYNIGQQAAIGDLYKTFPDVQNLVLHLQAGGKMDDFKSVVDYTKVKLDKENEAQLKDIIYKARGARGDRPEAIDRYYNALKAGDSANDNIYEDAEAELQYLVDKNKAEIKAKEDKIKDANDKAIEEDMNYWGVSVQDGKLVNLNKKGSVYDLVTKGELKVGDKSYKIPEQIRVVEDGKPKLYSRDDLFNYLYVPVTININGQRVQMTRNELDIYNEEQNRTVSDDLFESLKRFTKYDTSQFITEQVNNDKVSKIRKLKTKKSTDTISQQVDKSKGKKIVFKKNN